MKMVKKKKTRMASLKSLDPHYGVSKRIRASAPAGSTPPKIQLMEPNRPNLPSGIGFTQCTLSSWQR
jgi:hypothetical protein